MNRVLLDDFPPRRYFPEFGGICHVLLGFAAAALLFSAAAAAAETFWY